MSTLYSFLLLLLVKDAHTGLNIIQNTINVIQRQQTQNQHCDLSKLTPGYQIIKCTHDRSPCDLMCNIESKDIAMEVCCIDGIWDVPNYGRVVYRSRNPPTFIANTCPPPEIQSVYTTEIMKKTRQIDWKKPSAKDADGNVISDIQMVAGMEGGSEFVEGLHYITYLAKDQQGYQAFCSFHFEVHVIRCDSAIWPRHGYRECTSTDPIYGTRCSFECEEGYELNGDSKTECSENGKWTGANNLSCSKIKCLKPADPQNGKYTCSATGIEQEYQSICWAECNDGYGLEKTTFSQCSANKTWSTNRQPVCKDREPPKIKCAASYHHFYAESGNCTKNASWSLPTAMDAVDATNITIVQDSGLPVGSDLPLGFTTVGYHALDSQGNESPMCTTVLYVQEITCPHPSLQIIDDNMKISCKSLILGQKCTLSCRFRLPLIGDSEIICSADVGASVGKWTWLNKTEPHCDDIKCPTLTSPVNGAMTCDSIAARPFCSLSCNQDFDITYRFDGRYFCLDSGRWDPNNEVPNCTAPNRPHLWNLPSTLNYFSGSCNEQHIVDEIKGKFLQIIAKLPAHLRTNCTVDNVKVTCGAIQSRSRRTVHVDVSGKSVYPNGDWLVGIHSNIRHKRQTNYTSKTVLRFDIVVPWDQDNMSLTNAFAYHDNMTFTFRNMLIDLINAGKFDIKGFSRPSYHFEEYGNFLCKNGFLDRDVCKTCGAGTQYNDATDTCEECPLNKYQDEEGIFPCKECPPHHVTFETGRKHVTECIELCPVGTYSGTTVVPCIPCQIGSYQSSVGQKTCISCPEGKFTNSSGRTSQAECLNYDIYINSEISHLELGSFNADAVDLTFALWFQVSSTNKGPSFFSLSSYHPNHGEYFNIAIKDTVSVRIQQAKHTSSETVPLGKWVPLVVIVDSDSLLLTVRLKDNIVLQDNFSSGVNATILISGSSLLIDVGSNTNIHFTGLFVTRQKLSDNRLTSLSRSCSYEIPPSLLSMSDISRFRGISIHHEFPSSCDAVDECLSKPCGNHTCINVPSGFKCSCRHGYSGPTCATPPDLCRNNDCKNKATCINNGLDYKCKCSPGYRGYLCQEAPVNGNWSDWSAWSICSQSCGGGSRSRSRQCNSPAPGDYGSNCTGHEHEMENCNIKECPTCPELPLGIGIKVNVTVVDGTEIRKISCEDGLAFAPGFEPDQEYKCGISTNYNWAHTSNDNPLGRPPSCAEINGPERIATTTTVVYDTLPCSASSAAKATIEGRISPTCVSLNTCNMSVSTICSSNGTVVATITLSASLEGKENLDVQSFYNNQTVSENLYDLVQTVIELETSTDNLVNEATKTFGVEDRGRIHYVNTRSTDAFGLVTCPVGSTSLNGVCVKCPVGTYYEKSTSACQYCETGAYQDETARSVCKPCSLGYTTVGVGSVNFQDCIEKPESATTSHTKQDGGETNLALIIGCSLAGTLVISVLTGIIIYKWKRRVNSKRSFLSLRRAITPEPRQAWVKHIPPKRI